MTDVTRAIVSTDTTLTARGDSDDTFSHGACPHDPPHRAGFEDCEPPGELGLETSPRGPSVKSATRPATRVRYLGSASQWGDVHLADGPGLDNDDCAAGTWRWLMIELPAGGGLQIGAKYAIAGGWFVGAAPLDEDVQTPDISMRQDGYSMTITLRVPAGTRLSLWRGEDDD